MKRLTELREAKGLSQEDLAKKIGISVGKVEHWEDGSEYPNDWELYVLTSILNCSKAYLMGYSEHNIPPTPTSSQYIQSEMKPLQTNPLVPVSCPRCGNTTIAFVTEYHKSIFLRAIERILLAILFFVAISNFHYIFTTEYERFADSILFIFIAQTIISLLRFFIESKTHVQAICKACSHLWLLN